MLTTVAPVTGETGAGEPRSVERIRRAALRSFAEHGTGATTLRGVAAAAGVSLGLVQHHFSTKAGLIKAVDEYVLDVVITPMARPITESTEDSLAEVGYRVNGVFAEHPEVAAYMGRALVDGSALGTTIFDKLYEAGVQRWELRAERGETRSEIDIRWAVINSMVLALGAMSLRQHIDRHLPESLITPAQLERWQLSVSALLRDGLFRPTAPS
ncbi:TetR/AcrR family transcriptional regulator [Mycobacterium sp. C31M]